MQSFRDAIAALMLCAAAVAQQPAAPVAASPTIPSFTIRLSSASRVFLPYGEKSPVMVKQCDNSGNPYLWLLGSDGLEVVGFMPDAIVTFGRHQITDIPEPSFGTFAVGSSQVFILVNALENVREEKSSYYDETSQKEVPITGKVGDRRQYIARFDRDGSYKGAVRLDPEFHVQQLGVFESGNFLAAGKDVNNIPRVALLAASGVIQKFVDFGSDITDKPEASQTAFKKATGLEGELDVLALFTQMYSHGDRVVVLRALTNRPVFEVREGGAARPVKVKAPGLPGVDHMIPSDGNWLVDFTQMQPGGEVWNREHKLYEVDPATGALLKTYHLDSTDSKIYLACWFDGNFTAIEHRDGRLIRLQGSAEADKSAAPAPPAP